MRAKAYIFDVFGTVVDWRTGVATESFGYLDRLHEPIPANEFADLWRAKYQPAMQRIRTGGRGYLPLDTLHRENLDELLDDLGIADKYSAEERQEWNRAWEKLPPWPDSVAGLAKVKQGAIIAPCSNGSIALMTRLAKFGSLPWDCILGAEVAQTYKPQPEAYLKSVSALGLAPNEVCMVAAHNDDLVAARECGLQTAFIPRVWEHGEDQTTDLTPAENWDQVIDEIGQIQ